MAAAFRQASLLGLVLVLLACTGVGGPSRSQVEKALDAGRLDEAVALAERRRDHYPRDPTVRDELGEVYYKAARKALDEERYDDYTRFLSLALDEWVESLRLDPASPSPHTWMGIVAAYQGDLDRALNSFHNARRLGDRSPIHYSNLAEVYIYRGDLAKARRYMEKARRLGAPPVILEITGTLASWRSGDLVEARDLFDSAYGLDPAQVNSWNEAPVSDPIESFEDFTGYCCSHVACGPYMETPCTHLKHDIAHRKLRDETIRQELVIEMERRRKLEQIYRGRKDLQVEIEDAE
jgi:tetratricopeptide (TPR) repeat protein